MVNGQYIQWGYRKWASVMDVILARSSVGVCVPERGKVAESGVETPDCISGCMKRTRCR